MNTTSETMLSLEEHAKHCIVQTNNLQKNVVLPNILIYNPEAGSLVASIHSELAELEEVFKQLHKLAVARHTHIGTVQSMNEYVNNFHNRILTSLEHLPSCQPSVQLPAVKNTNSGAAGGKSSTPMYRSSKGRIVETPCVEDDDIVFPGETDLPTCSELRKKGPVLFMPSIEHLTDEEFETVPKYMKGRITCKQVNTAIDELNKAVDAKYVLLKTSKAHMTEAVRRAIRQYKDQERKETKGLHFIVDSDITNLTRFSLDRAGRSVLVILRHCGRIREVRGGGFTRYCIC